MARVAFLHTAEAHVVTFRALLRETAPDIEDVPLVDPALLSDALESGVDDSLRARLQSCLDALVAQEPSVIVCTCSTLAGEAEALGAEGLVPVLRVDRPMAEAAVHLGSRIAIVAALASTLEPTQALVERAAAAAEKSVTILQALRTEAWALFEAGDDQAYLSMIAGEVRHVVASRDVDVVVLAQASMAGALNELQELSVPVLCSPRLAAERAVAMTRSDSKTGPSSRLVEREVHDS